LILRAQSFEQRGRLLACAAGPMLLLSLLFHQDRHDG
jgi:hypothetical protein